jgi:NAD(P)-dependent dehydrogenase (short-subunit alcohol dehydrogenase family)
LWKAKQDVADMAAKTHTILIAGGSGLVGHAAVKFAIAAGQFVIALVRRGGSLSVEGLPSEETLKIIEVDFDALDQYQPEISALAPNALICALGATIRKAGSISICAPKAKQKRPFAPAAICASTTRVRVFFWVSGLKLAPVSASASLQRR